MAGARSRSTGHPTEQGAPPVACPTPSAAINRIAFVFRFGLDAVGVLGAEGDMGACGTRAHDISVNTIDLVPEAQVEPKAI